MRLKLLSFLLIAAVFVAQTTCAVAQVAVQVATQGPQSNASTEGSITIPAGKVIPLTLLSPIKSKSTKVGDTIRAQVAFPITVGGLIAIPPGTYVEGIIQSVAAKKTKANPGGLRIRFTRLIYANGYTVALDAVNTVSSVTFPSMVPLNESVGAGDGIGMGLAVLPIPLAGLQPFAGQTASPPALPPLPAPPKAWIVSVVVSLVAFVGLMIWIGIANRHSATNMDTLLYDAGYQFQMATTVPVTVDAAQASSAAALLPQ